MSLYAIEAEVVGIVCANDVSLERIVLRQDKIFEKRTTVDLGDLNDEKGKMREGVPQHGAARCRYRSRAAIQNVPSRRH